MYDLIVIGAGPGGYEAAAYAARMGKTVLLAEKNDIGGTCLNVGCIPTKTLLRSAKAYADCKEASKYGVSVSDPVVDMAAVQDRKKQVVDMLSKGVVGMLKKTGVKVVKGEATILKRGLVRVGGETYETENILIATGSVPAVPPIPGLAENPIAMDSTGILSLDVLPTSLAVIGGGVIGLEFACFFAEFGTAVTVVEKLPRLAPMVDIDISKRLQAELKRIGVTFHLSTCVSKIEGRVMHLTGPKNESKTIEIDCILNATGRLPVTRNIGLESVGVDVERTGIRVDDLGKTNIPGIWACGDCTGRLLLAHSATREGIVAVNNMFGEPDRMRFGTVPRVIYTHPEVAQVGATEAELVENGIAYRKAVMPMAVAGRFVVEHAGKSGTVKVLVGEEHGQVLGVHMIGSCCGEFIASAVAMIELELRVKDVREIVFPHPTVSESLKEVLLHA